MQYLKQSTVVKVVVGPFLDKDDGLTPETGITLGAADRAEAVKHDAASVTDISGNTFAAITDADGLYNLTLSADDTATLGMLTVYVDDVSVCLAVRADYMVVPANVWDSLFSTDKLQVDVTQIEGADATDTIIGADSDTLETLSDQLDTVTNKTNLITVGGLDVVSPVASNETVEIVAGDDYASADSTAIVFTVAGYAGPSLTDATVRMAIVNKDEYDAGSAAADLTTTGTGVDTDGTATFTFELTASQTDGLNTQPPQDSYSYVYQVTVETSGGNMYTVAIGSMNVRGNVTNG